SKIELLLAQRAAGRVRAVLLGSMQRERAPSAPDVQESLPWLDIQFSANVLNFPELRLVQTLVRTLKVTARIDHPRVQKLRVEFVGLVVVKTDIRSGATTALKPRLHAFEAEVRQGTVEEIPNTAM